MHVILYKIWVHIHVNSNGTSVIRTLRERHPGLWCLVEEHDANLEKVRSILRNAGVALNPDKEHVRQSSVEFLGHVVSADGVSPSQQRFAAISELQAPADLPALRRVLGIFNYLSKFSAGNGHRLSAAPIAPPP